MLRLNFVIKFIHVVKGRLEMKIRITSKNSTTVLAYRFNTRGCRIYWQEYRVILFSARSADEVGKYIYMQGEQLNVSLRRGPRFKPLKSLEIMENKVISSDGSRNQDWQCWRGPALI
jgi:hypothetical protein